MKITAKMITYDVGAETAEKDRVMREQYSMSGGFHRNALKVLSEGDIQFAELLCKRGYSDALLLRPGLWSIGGYYYYPKSSSWTYDTQVKATSCDSFDQFVEAILGDTTFCKVDKK